MPLQASGRPRAQGSGYLGTYTWCLFLGGHLVGPCLGARAGPLGTVVPLAGSPGVPTRGPSAIPSCLLWPVLPATKSDPCSLLFPMAAPVATTPMGNPAGGCWGPRGNREGATGAQGGGGGNIGGSAKLSVPPSDSPPVRANLVPPRFLGRLASGGSARWQGSDPQHKCPWDEERAVHMGRLGGGGLEVQPAGVGHSLMGGRETGAGRGPCLCSLRNLLRPGVSVQGGCHTC